MEVHAELGVSARENLAEMENAKVEISDQEGSPFDPSESDAIFVNAGMTHVLQLWLDRLRNGGPLVVPPQDASEESQRESRHQVEMFSLTGLEAHGGHGVPVTV
jgi:protein-L-isoaspartate O-methyltransferase